MVEGYDDYLEILINDIICWMKNYHQKSGQECWVIGVSGGVDSAVATYLSVKTNIPVIAIAMPLNLSHTNSLNRAMELCINKPEITFHIREIKSIIDSFLQCGMGQTKIRQGNLRSRIRANILYDFSHEYSGLVVGTGNKDEDQIGYFTKGGDGLVDLCPLSGLHKSTVYDIAKKLDVPQSIIDAKPSAELWDGQTDEDELGMSYKEISWAINFAGINGSRGITDREAVVLKQVRAMRRKNAHKLGYPPIFQPRDEYIHSK